MRRSARAGAAASNNGSSRMKGVIRMTLETGLPLDVAMPERGATRGKNSDHTVLGILKHPYSG